MNPCSFKTLIRTGAVLAVGTLLSACGDPYAPITPAADSNTDKVSSCLRVPQDYPTLSYALSQQAGSQADNTICLAGGTYHENIIVPYVRPTLKIVPQGADPVVIDGSMSFRNGSGQASLVIEGVEITGDLDIDGWIPTQLINSKVRWVYSALTLVDQPSLLIDRCDLGGVYVYSGPTNPHISTDRDVVITNNYIHDGKGILIRGDHADLIVRILNNTLVRGDVGIQAELNQSNGVLEIFNNLVYGNRVEMSLGFTYGFMQRREGSNAFFTSNPASFVGYTPHYNDVTADPMLDMTTTPPSPRVGSPLLNGGDPGHTSDHDFTGAPRVGGITIGAIQAPSVPTTN